MLANVSIAQNIIGYQKRTSICVRLSLNSVLT